MNKIGKLLFVNAVALAAMCAVKPAAGENDSAEQKLIATLESKIVLPRGAHNLQQYVRYYESFGVRGKSEFHAVYVFENGIGEVKIVEENALPKIQDGGCDVINLIFTRAGKVVSVQCAGRG